MAIYKALAQNTYKFINEVTVNNIADPSIPMSPIFPKVKVITADGVLWYKPLTPCCEDTSATDLQNCASAVSAGGSKLLNEARGDLLYYYPSFWEAEDRSSKVNIDGVIYAGVRNAKFCYHKKSSYAQGSSNYTESYLAAVAPAFKLTVVAYSVVNGAISATEFTVPKRSAGAVAKGSGSGSTYVTIRGQIMWLVVPKADDDIILAMSIEYPKYDVTLSNTVTGLQYSLDNGLTFTDVTEGLALSQIEHVVFRNTGEADINIGTTEGGAEIGTITAGSDFVAVPEADGTWYIS